MSGDYCIIPCARWHTSSIKQPGWQQLQHQSVATTAAALKPRGKKIRRLLPLHDRRAASYLGQKQYSRGDINKADVFLHRQMHCPEWPVRRAAKLIMWHENRTWGRCWCGGLDWALWAELTCEAWRGRQDSVHPGSNTSARLLRGAQPPEFVYVIDLRYNVVILLTWRSTWVHRSQSFNFISCWKEATWRNGSRKQEHPHPGLCVITDSINQRTMIRSSITSQRYCQRVASDAWFPRVLGRLRDEWHEEQEEMFDLVSGVNLPTGGCVSMAGDTFT